MTPERHRGRTVYDVDSRGGAWKHIHGLIVRRDARIQLVTLMRV